MCVGISTLEAALAAAPDDFHSGCIAGAERVLQRYMGHCNVQTDIKEAAFLGDDDALIAAGLPRITYWALWHCSAAKAGGLPAGCQYKTF